MILNIMGAEQWQYVEQGRSPGKQPPLNRIMEWCVARGIPKEAAFPIARKIGQFGAPKDKTKLNVIADTMKAVEPDILRELDKQAEASFEATIGKQWQSL
jgi:fructose-1,6-bisphosphatase/inositol monophosphatase family enzyme